MDHLDDIMPFGQNGHWGDNGGFFKKREFENFLEEFKRMRSEPRLKEIKGQ
ncbi:hypothetical protein [Paenibacillus cremeus]|uniref:hypothetical protein n=1 Tax=Paenibacillus cremeus TaxID=2163881 RepID=UPI001C954791|nr:hypothetical protein [Paenibacillus cremeus]